MEHDSSVSAAPAFDAASTWRDWIIGALNVCAAIIVAPLACVAALERRLSSTSEGCFLTGAQLLALMPGYPGVYLRRGYYWWTLERCSLRVFIGFGSYFSHRAAVAEDHVYIGSYAVIGSVHLGRWALIGSRASILSGGSLHSLDEHGRWLPADLAQMTRVQVGAHAWIGEAAVVMADVGRGAMVAAGSVVSSAVRDGIMVGGNPARFIKAFDSRAQVANPS